MIKQDDAFQESIFHEKWASRDPLDIFWGRQGRKHCVSCSRKAGLGDIIEKAVEIARFYKMIEWNDLYNLMEDSGDEIDDYQTYITYINKNSSPKGGIS